MRPYCWTSSTTWASYPYVPPGIRVLTATDLPADQVEALPG